MREHPGADGTRRRSVEMQEKATGRGRDPRLVSTGTTGVYKRGNRYVVSFTRPDGRRGWRSAKTLREARALRSQLAADVSRGEYQEATRLTLAAYAATWLDTYSGRTGRGVRTGTLDKYRADLNRHVLPVLGQRRLTAVAAQDVKSLARRLRETGLGAASVRNALAPLRALYATAVEENLVRVNPCATLRLPGPDEDRVKALDEEQLATLAAAVPDGRDRLLVEFMAASGLRIGEALGLRWDDLDLGGAVVSVTRQLQGAEHTRTKTRSGQRLVKLPTGLAARMRAYRVAAPYSLDSDPVFATRSGRPLSRHNVYRTLRRAAEQADLPEWVSPHSLRHSYARRLLVAGVGIRMLATLLGHSDPAFTMRRYARFLPSDVRALDVDFLSPAGG